MTQATQSGLVFGALGILVHNLIKINELNKDPNKSNFTLKSYLKTEWAAISVSACAVGAIVYGKSYVDQFENLKQWFGVVAFTAGYMGQSLIIAAMGKAQKKVDQITE